MKISKIAILAGVFIIAITGSFCYSQVNLAYNKPYQLSVKPYDQYDQYMDNKGPQAFQGTCLWYRGELTNGSNAPADYWSNQLVKITQQGPYSVIIDLKSLSSVSGFYVYAFGGGLYGAYLPAKIDFYGTSSVSSAMSFDGFCSSFSTENQNWQYLGSATHSVSENGSSSLTYTFTKNIASTQLRLVKIVVTDKLVENCSTNLSEIVVFGDAGASLTAAGSLVDFPVEGRDAFFPVNLDIYNKCHDINSFIIGNSADIADPPFGSRLATAGMIMDVPGGMKAKGVQLLNNMGTRTLRFWDSFWVNYRSDIERVKIINFCTGKSIPIPTNDVSSVYPDYKKMIDICAANNWVCVMVLDTFYYDPLLDKIYTTPEVCRNCPDDPADPYYTTDITNPNGILYKAVARNVIPIAQYYKDMGYTTGLVLEIGNEAIGYINDYAKPNYVRTPSLTEHARLINAYARAIKAVSEDIGTTIYPFPDSSVFTEAAKLGAAKYIDYCVSHHYAPRFNQGSLLQDINACMQDLEKAGMGHVKMLHTEYCLDWQNAGMASYTTAVNQMMVEIAMMSNSMAAGMHEFALFQNAKIAHSDTYKWTVRRYGEDANRPVDLHPELRWRYITLPSGMTQTLLAKVAKGTLIKYWPGTNVSIGGLMTQDSDTRRVLLINPSSSAMPLQWNRTVPVLKQYLLTSTAEYFSHTLTQPWTIAETSGGSLPSSLPSMSAVLVELNMPAFSVAYDGNTIPNDTGVLDFGVVRQNTNKTLSLDIVNAGSVNLNLLDTSRIELDEKFTSDTLDTDMWEQTGGSYAIINGKITLTSDSASSSSIISKEQVKLIPGGKVIVRSDDFEMQEWATGAFMGLQGESLGQIADMIGLVIEELNGQKKVCVIMKVAGQASQILGNEVGPQNVESGWTLTWESGRVTLVSDIWGTVFDSLVNNVDKDGVSWRIPDSGTMMSLSCCSGYNLGYWVCINDFKLTSISKVEFTDSNNPDFSVTGTPPASVLSGASESVSINILPSDTHIMQNGFNIFTDLGSYYISLYGKGTFATDSNLDGIVGFSDLQVLASQWLTTGTELSGDIDKNGTVNLLDFVVLANDWLHQVDWY